MDFLAARALYSPYEVEDATIDAIVKETTNTLRKGRITKLEFLVGRTMVKVAREPWPDYTHVQVETLMVCRFALVPCCLRDFVVGTTCRA